MEKLKRHVLERLSQTDDAPRIVLEIDGSYLEGRAASEHAWKRALNEIGVAVRAALATRSTIKVVVLGFPMRNFEAEAFVMRIQHDR